MGANPGTIGASSNLEVEAAASGTATTGNKFIVNKVTGQVTIQDGTQGTGKVFTSDGNGAGNWAFPTAGVNLYNADGILTGNRTVTLGGKSLLFTDSQAGGPFMGLQNTSTSNLAYSAFGLRNDVGGTYFFLNSSTRTGDGGPNTTTLRNDAGGLRLLSSGSNGISIAGGTGAVTINAATTIQDGTQGAGKVFTSDANGTGSWVAPAAPAVASVYAFAATTTTTPRQSVPQSGGGTTAYEMTYQASNINTANAFVPATGRFTAPSSGFYVLYASTQFDNGLVAGQPNFLAAGLTIDKNRGLGSAARLAQTFYFPNALIVSATASTIVYLNAGDYISATVGAQVSSGSTFQVVSSSFYGYKIAN